MKKYVLLVLAVLVCATTSLAAQTVVEEIIARINDQIVTRSDMERSLAALRAEAQQQGAEAQAQLSEKEKNALRDLIDQQLLAQRGKENGINAETDLIKRLDEIRKQANLETMEELEKAAQAQGVSFEDFKNNLRNNIITQQVIGQEVGRKLSISQSEINQFYEEHKKEMEQPEQIHLAEILIAIPAASSTESPEAVAQSEEARTAAAEDKAKQLLDSIRNGAKFEDVAKASSNGPTAEQGGDLGIFKRGMLAKELEELTFALKTGDVSGVIRTRQGFIILKALDHQPAGLPPVKSVEPQIQEQIYYSKLQPALRAFLTKLREESFIDIKQGYVDTGASPNQTKPVITAATGEDAKTPKKKKKKKLLLF